MLSRQYCDVDTFLPIQFGNQLFVQVDVNVVSSVLRCGHVSSYTVWNAVRILRNNTIPYFTRKY